MTNKELYDKASRAINDLFYDVIVPAEKCRANLEGLMEEIEVLLESISDDGGE